MKKKQNQTYYVNFFDFLNRIFTFFIVYNVQTKEVEKMSSIKTLDKSNISILEEREVIFENEKITYRFYRIDFIETTKFAISVKLRNECEICFLGSEVSYSKVLYDLICRNAVTPCTLPYIIEDFCKEKY